MILIFPLSCRYAVPKTPFSLPSTVGCSELNSLINGMLHKGMLKKSSANYDRCTHKILPWIAMLCRLLKKPGFDLKKRYFLKIVNYAVFFEDMITIWSLKLSFSIGILQGKKKISILTFLSMEFCWGKHLLSLLLKMESQR